MSKQLPVADDLECRNLVSRYAHYADAGELDLFADLFLTDGVWRRENVPPKEHGGSGLPAEDKVGHAALKEMIDTAIIKQFNRRFRHQFTDVLVEPGDSPDTAKGRARALITDWRSGPGKIAMCGNYTFGFSKTPAGWKFSLVSIYVFPD